MDDENAAVSCYQSSDVTDYRIGATGGWGWLQSVDGAMFGRVGPHRRKTGGHPVDFAGDVVVGGETESFEPPRDYDEAVLERLRFIRSAQAVGLTLGEIREVVAFRERGESPCAHVLGLLETHAADVDRRIRELRNLRRELGKLAQRAAALNPDECLSSEVCHLVTRSS